MATRNETHAYINRIATAVPHFEVHNLFVEFARRQMAQSMRHSAVLRRMVDLAGIEHRYSCVNPGPTYESHPLYRVGAFPDTATRMVAFERHAPKLAEAAVERLALGRERDRVSHLIITCCTGFSAPGLDFDVMDRCGLSSSIERTIVGFMGCYAAINALKLAHHIVRSAPDARVLVVSVELCSLHLQETQDLEQILSFLLFGDGCAAALITAEPKGLAIDSFRAVLVPGTREMITWTIRNFGFDMVLSGRVPGAIRRGLNSCADEILRGEPPSAIDLWGVHPGGRTVLDAVERAFGVPSQKLAAAREVLRQYGNMSSATVMFVLEALMRHARPGQLGCALSFGPGLVAETMLFHAVSAAGRARDLAEQFQLTELI
jgi:predicted naringenin-chalcone synthase